jgi:hypothetical protein
MSALTIDLMGNTPLDEATIQARAQDIIAAEWAPWKRERALRLAATGDAVQLDALNAYMAEISAEVDLSRDNSALLAAALAVEAAQTRLALPAYDGPATIEGEEGPQPHPDQVRDDDERTAAHEVIYLASPQVLALVASRVPPPPEPAPEPEPELPAGL